MNFCTGTFTGVLAERRIMHRRTRPHRHHTNGKAEQITYRTLADEFLNAKRFRPENERRIRLKRWIHHHNCHQHHTTVGGPPASQADNLTQTDSCEFARGGCRVPCSQKD